MKLRKQLLKTLVFTTVFALGIGLITNVRSTPTEVEAAQHAENYGTYTYSGDYYDSIDFDAAGGMNGALRTSLTSHIIPAAFYTYGKQGENHLATQLQYADEDPTNSNNMVYLYTRDSVAKNPASSWNREHCWCQSLSNGNWGTSEGGTDILHLRPTYDSVNSSRGNTPYGNTGKATVKKYNNMTFGYTGNGYFEPLDCVKGDVARIIMYVWTTYTGYKNYSPLNILSVFQSYDTLLSWHMMDKPDLLEGNRNDYCQTSRQKNRNPFVDHPELAWKIFGDQVSDSVRTACQNAYPANGGGETVDPTGISLNKTTASVEAGKTLQLRATLTPANASGSISWTSNNTSVAIVSSSGLVTAKTAGSVTITATVGSYSASCVITVTEATISYGTADNPISVADAIEIINITGTAETPQPLYVKGIVSSNSAFNAQYNNYDSIWLSNEDDNTAEAFQLYRAEAPTSVTNTYKTEDSLEGYQVVAYGYGKKFNNTTYELTTYSGHTPYHPQVLSVSTPDATAIDLNLYSAEIEVGETVTLTATLTPSNSNSTYTWSSSDTDIATVSNGVVTGVAAGTATITARVAEDIEASCEVTVTAAQQATDVTIDLSTNNTTTVSENEISWVVSNVGSIVCNRSTATTAANNYYGGANNRTSTRFYTNSILSITPSSGVEITSVVFNATSEGYANALKNSSWTNASSSVSSTTVTIIPTDGTEVFSAIIGGTCGFTSIVINYHEVEVVITPRTYMGNASSIATIHGRSTTVDNGSGTDNIVFANEGYNNGDLVTLEAIGNVTLAFDKGTNSNAPKYYDTGSAVRVYPNNTLTFASSTPITRIEFSFSSGSATYLSPSTGSMNGNVWTGSTLSVVFTCTIATGSHLRITEIGATYGQSVTTVDNVVMRFGASIPAADWTSIAENWEITDYGVMCMKKTSLDSYASEGITTVEQAFRHNKTVSDLNSGTGDHPYPVEDNYVFTVRIGVSLEDYYNMVVCAAPYILADGHYYFLPQMTYCVRSLAKHYLDNQNLECALPNSALRVLKGNYEG